MILDTYRPVDAAVTAAIHLALEPFREVLAIGAVRIVPGESHAGDPAIHVSLEHRPVEALAPFDVFHAADDEVRDAVWGEGERRFVFLNHEFSERQEHVGSR